MYYIVPKIGVTEAQRQVIRVDEINYLLKVLVKSVDRDLIDTALCCDEVVKMHELIRSCPCMHGVSKL